MRTTLLVSRVVVCGVCRLATMCTQVAQESDSLKAKLMLSPLLRMPSEVSIDVKAEEFLIVGYEEYIF